MNRPLDEFEIPKQPSKGLNNYHFHFYILLILAGTYLDEYYWLGLLKWIGFGGAVAFMLVRLIYGKPFWLYRGINIVLIIAITVFVNLQFFQTFHFGLNNALYFGAFAVTVVFYVLKMKSHRRLS